MRLKNNLRDNLCQIILTAQLSVEEGQLREEREKLALDLPVDAE